MQQAGASVLDPKVLLDVQKDAWREDRGCSLAESDAGVPTDQTSLFPALQGPAWPHLQSSCSAATSTLPRFPRPPSCLHGDLLSSACSHHSQGPEGQGEAGLLCGHSAPWAITPPICQLGPLPYLWPRPWSNAIDMGLSLRGTKSPPPREQWGALRAAGSPLAWEGQPHSLWFTWTCAQPHSHTHTHPHTRAYPHTCTPTHVRTHPHTCMHTHVCTSTHTHTCSHPSCPQDYNWDPHFQIQAWGTEASRRSSRPARFLGRSGFLEAAPAPKPNYFRALHVTGWGQQLDHLETTHSSSRLAEPWLLGTGRILDALPLAALSQGSWLNTTPIPAGLGLRLHYL